MSYRPISLSESIIPELDKKLLDNDFHIHYNKSQKKLQLVRSNTSLNKLNELNELTDITDLVELPVESNNSNNNENNNQNSPLEKPKNKCSDILMKKILLFITHLLLISFFEIMFFNYFIANYEDKALTNLVSSITKNLNNGCINLTIQEKEVITYIFNNIININGLYNTSINAASQRVVYNKNLFNLGWYYLGGIAFLNLIFIGLNLYYKKAKLHKILFDNFIMIILLGLYEYLFFSTIVLQYENMSTPEIEYSFFNKINNCYLT